MGVCVPSPDPAASPPPPLRRQVCRRLLEGVPEGERGRGWRRGTAARWANGIIKRGQKEKRDKRWTLMSVPEGGSGWGEETVRVCSFKWFVSLMDEMLQFILPDFTLLALLVWLHAHRKPGYWEKSGRDTSISRLLYDLHADQVSFPFFSSREKTHQASCCMHAFVLIG